MKKGKKKPDKKKKDDSQRPSKERTSNENREQPFDYGGIPERDLKKNLGCG